MQINIEKEKLEARYTDFAMITNNFLGFNFDFGQRSPRENEVIMISRLALTPQHAKLFLEILKNNIDNYEKQFGEIKTPVSKRSPEDDKKIVHFVQ